MLVVSSHPIYPQSFHSCRVVLVRMTVMTRMPRVTGMTQSYVILGFLVILVIPFNFGIRVILVIRLF